MPEQTTLSIKAALAPHIGAGLHATVLEHVRGAPAERSSRGGDVIHNKITGTVHGTAIQVGKINGGFHVNG
ncbi:hypothetical protein SAMN05216553_106263 [Lentzea fradiae]|uniref:Uncharacterized protein n=1 Tax=Lentzea fradiae TaxID=200378 RepID=A0A1G7SHJ6_9PSEU|nr:hypothetical protein [Lentzea fradiae]SDG22535.1 hypothetical protein SAMN05216553_106263 [Lentzea fradiae]